MAYCPRCNFEYRSGVERCPDCGCALVAGSPPAAAEALPLADTESVRLCLVPDPTEAEIIQAALAQAGVRSVLHTYGPLTGRLTRVADGATHDYCLIFVTKNRLAEARQILAEIKAGPIDWPEGMEPEE